MKKIGILTALMSFCVICGGMYALYLLKNADMLDDNPNVSQYCFPAEDAFHEGTWLTWPHEYTYGKSYKNAVEYIWVEMTKALSEGEKVHIVAYDETEKKSDF